MVLNGKEGLGCEVRVEGMHETLLALVLLYAQETMIWRKRSRIRVM